MKKHLVFRILINIITFKWLFVLLIHFYKKCISPLLPNNCIYFPSCSTYMLQAIDKHGAFKGVFLGTKRLMRCVPWKDGGLDPVPDNKKGDMKWMF